MVSFQEERFDNVHAHIEQAQTHAVNAYYLGNEALVAAATHHKQHRLEDAMSEALHALGIFEELGNQWDIRRCKRLLQDIKRAMSSPDASAVSFRQ